MNKKQKIFLVAFGTTDLKKSIKRLQLQAQNSKFYDDIKIFDDESLDKIIGFIKEKGPKKFQYNYEIEIESKITPKTWSKKLF